MIFLKPNKKSSVFLKVDKQIQIYFRVNLKKEVVRTLKSST